jgi:hypothetical protein
MYIINQRMNQLEAQLEELDSIEATILAELPDGKEITYEMWENNYWRRQSIRSAGSEPEVELNLLEKVYDSWCEIEFALL